MDSVFCTLFDSNYLDKGLVLIDSMREHIPDYRLYVFAFDERCYQVLEEEAIDNVIPVSLTELEQAYPVLLQAKADRNSVEYNWTCSSWTIKYVLEQFHEPICTYIDADMRFFSSPEPVFEQMRARDCSVIIVPHRFHSDKFEQEEGPKTGFYCVEFNTFLADEHGMTALNWWTEQCCNWCHYIVPSVEKWYGDQKYLNEFPRQFQGVYVCDHYGVGLGPWNDNRMVLVSTTNQIMMQDRQIKKKYPLILYHFSGVRFINNHLIKVSSRMSDRKLHKVVFDSYVQELLKKQNYLSERYGMQFIKKQPVLSNNPLMKLYHKYIMPIIRMRHFYNLYRI